MTRTTRTAARTAVALAPVLAAALLSESPAAAAPPASQPLTAFGAVWVDAWGPTSATVCAYGEFDDGTYVAGVWTFTVAGARADGLPPVAASTPRVGPTFGGCLDVDTGGFLAGIKATLALGGVGTADVTTVAGLVGARTVATAPFAIQYTTSG